MGINTRIKKKKGLKMPQKLRTCKRKTKDDEFYTQYRDVVRELHKYDLRKYNIICCCDNKKSNIYKYLKDCYYNVKCDDKDWRKNDYSKYNLVITNPPFSQIKEFISYLIDLKIKFIIICSDVLRYMIKKEKLSFKIPLYSGKDVQKFLRPDGEIKFIHCGWISNFQDDFKENKIMSNKF